MDFSTKNTNSNEKTTTEAANNVRRRLIDTAEALFGEKGFNGTSIRDITTRANCNVAAVNYHFHGKDNLYFEIFSNRLDILRDVRISGINKAMRDENVTLEKLLYAFANAFIEPLLAESGGRHFIKVMLREMLDPRLPREMFLEKTIIPVMAVLQNALVKICPQLDIKQAQMVIGSVVGQLLHIIRVKDHFQTIDKKFPAFELSEAVDHVVAFSTAGIKGLIETK